MTSAPPGQHGGPPEGLEGPTHILAADFGAAFFQTVLDVFPLVALVVPQASDEVVQRFLEPVGISTGGSGMALETAGGRTWLK